MPYTLVKGLVWILLALLLGFIIGWLLRSVTARRQIIRARSNNVGTVELDRLRGRVANLEPVVAERDRLQGEVASLRAAGGHQPPARAEADEPESRPLPTERTDPQPEVQAFVDASTIAPVHESPAGESPVDASGDDSPGERAPARADQPPAAPDVSQAHAILGRSVTLDDLKAVEGIGPKIEELCNGIGILTWWDLATTEVSLLRTMLADAGTRFKTQEPTTWPEQARLLAEGRWIEFKSMIDELDGGRPRG